MEIAAYMLSCPEREAVRLETLRASRKLSWARAAVQRVRELASGNGACGSEQVHDELAALAPRSRTGAAFAVLPQRPVEVGSEDGRLAIVGALESWWGRPDEVVDGLGIVHT